MASDETVAWVSLGDVVAACMVVVVVVVVVVGEEIKLLLPCVVFCILLGDKVKPPTGDAATGLSYKMKEESSHSICAQTKTTKQLTITMPDEEDDDFLNKPPQAKPRQDFFAVAKQVEQIQKARVPRLSSFSSEEILQKFFDLYADEEKSDKHTATTIDPLSQQREIDNFIRLSARKRRPKKKAVTFMEQVAPKIHAPLEDVDEKFFSPLVKQLSTTDMFKSSMSKLLTMNKFQSILRESLFYTVLNLLIFFVVTNQI